MTEKEKIFIHLNAIAQILPIPVYWLDLDGKMVGSNKEFNKVVGAPNDFNPMGKTAYEAYSKEIADNIVRHNKKIIMTGKHMSQEEEIKDVATGKNTRYLKSIKAPLYDDEGNIIGMIGSSIDITSMKESEKIKIENELYKLNLQTQEKFKRILKQTAHDIASPVASLNVLAEMGKEYLPENVRIGYRSVTASISSISNKLLMEFNKVESTQGKESFLVLLVVNEVLSSKRYQYKDRNVEFQINSKPNDNFIFINANKLSFERMISNLVNNSVDAFEDQGKVTVDFLSKEKEVEIKISDNGKGIPKEVLKKIMNCESVTHGKEDGHGIGMTQVMDTLKENNGKIQIKSSSKGTIITLSFEKVGNPGWLLEEVSFFENDTIVILDDNDSIHDAWDAKLKQFKSGDGYTKRKQWKDTNKVK